MYEEKEIIQKINEVNEKVQTMEANLAQIEERTKKLDAIDTTLHDLRAEIPRTDEIASTNYVDKRVNQSKNKMTTYVIGTGIGLIGAIAGILRLFVI